MFIYLGCVESVKSTESIYFLFFIHFPYLLYIQKNTKAELIWVFFFLALGRHYFIKRWKTDATALIYHSYTVIKWHGEVQVWDASPCRYANAGLVTKRQRMKSVTAVKETLNSNQSSWWNAERALTLNERPGAHESQQQEKSRSHPSKVARRV